MKKTVAAATMVFASAFAANAQDISGFGDGIRDILTGSNPYVENHGSCPGVVIAHVPYCANECGQEGYFADGGASATEIRTGILETAAGQADANGDRRVTAHFHGTAITADRRPEVASRERAGNAIKLAGGTGYTFDRATRSHSAAQQNRPQAEATVYIADNRQLLSCAVR